MNKTLETLFVFLSILSFLLALVGVFSVYNLSYDDLVEFPDLFSGDYDDLVGVPVVDLSHGLVLHIPFDRSVLDKSGYGFDATDSGIVSVDGRFDGAYLFDDTADSCVVGANDVLNFSSSDFSVSLWFYLNDNSSQMELFHREVDTNGWRVSASVYGGVLDVIIVNPPYNDIRVWDGSIHFSVDTWYHVVISKNSSNIFWFIDNVFDGISGDVSGIQFSGFDISLGNGYGVNLDGLLDDVRVYNRVLSSYERSALYGLGV